MQTIVEASRRVDVGGRRRCLTVRASDAVRGLSRADERDVWTMPPVYCSSPRPSNGHRRPVDAQPETMGQTGLASGCDSSLRWRPMGPHHLSPPCLPAVTSCSSQRDRPPPGSVERSIVMFQRWMLALPAALSAPLLPPRHHGAAKSFSRHEGAISKPPLCPRPPPPSPPILQPLSSLQHTVPANGSDPISNPSIDTFLSPP